MAAEGKLTKFKAALKKMQHLKLGRGTKRAEARSFCVSVAEAKDLHPVYVGESRRCYLLSSETMENPLIRELLGRRRCSGGDGSSSTQTINVRCEVVLFEHLLWMLENSDPQPESLDEIVDFYTF